MGERTGFGAYGGCSKARAPTLRRLCNTAPWGPERRSVPGLFLPDSSQSGKGDRGPLSKEAEADRPGGAQGEQSQAASASAHLPMCSTSLSSLPSSFHLAIPTLVQTTSRPCLEPAPASPPPPVPSALRSKCLCPSDQYLCLQMRQNSKWSRTRLWGRTAGWDSWLLQLVAMLLLRSFVSFLIDIAYNLPS